LTIPKQGQLQPSTKTTVQVKRYIIQSINYVPDQEKNITQQKKYSPSIQYESYRVWTKRSRKKLQIML